MIIINILRLMRVVWLEARAQREEAMRRYPYLRWDD
jgi:hypothetical protein